MTRTNLIKRLERLKQQAEAITLKAAALKAELAVNCKHESTWEIREASDNGYGSWWYTHYSVCNYCGNKERTGQSPYS